MADYQYEQSAMREERREERRANRDAVASARKAAREVGWDCLTDDEQRLLAKYT